MTTNNIAKTIRPIFSPAIALLNRIGFTQKFTLLWLTSLVAIAVVVYSLFTSLGQVIVVSQRELQGLALIEPVSQTVRLIQQHRGISAALLGGNKNMKERRAVKEREVANAFNTMEAKLPSLLVSSADFRHIKAEWERLGKEGIHWSADENFIAHTRLIEQVHLFEVSIADDYALITNADIATFYLIDTTINKLPHALEHLGQLRAYGNSILSKRQITERQRIKLNNLIANLDNTLHELSINIEKTGRYSPTVEKSLKAAHVGLGDSARQIISRVESDILTGNFATPPDVFLDMSTEKIDNSYTHMYQLLPVAESLSKKRLAKAENMLYLSVVSALLLLLLVVYISVSIYYTIITSINSLVYSAHAFADGNLDYRVKIDTHDEFRKR